MFSIDPLWAMLLAVVLVLFVVDLVVLGRRERVPSFRSSAWLSGFWLVVGLGFTAAVAAVRDAELAAAYAAGYVVERTLSLDNVFVFALVFASLAVPSEAQGRILSWGIALALVLRGLFILVGAALLATFGWVAYLFGAFLVLTGVKIAKGGSHVDPEKTIVMRALRRVAPHATPVTAALVAVALFDLVFALDSIPAIFAITDDAMIVFAANAFALLGLRPLFFLVSGAMRRVEGLDLGLGLVLVFVGGKLLVADWWKAPVWASLAGIAAGLLLGAAIGRFRTRSGRGGGEGEGGVAAAEQPATS